MTALLLALLMGAGLQVASFPIPAPGAHPFVVPENAGDPGTLWFLGPEGLTAYEGMQTSAKLDFPFEAGVSAVDVYDIDGDGSREVVYVQGAAVRQYEIVDDTVRGPDTLFEVPSRLGAPGSRPFLHALAVPIDDGVGIALPVAEALTIFNLDGTVHTTYQMGQDAAPQVVFGRPFTQWSSTTAELGSSDALEFRISRVEAFKPRLPEEALPWPVAAPVRPHVSRGRTRDPARPPQDWPYFALTSAGSVPRAAYLTTGPEHFETLIRIGDRGETEEDATTLGFGPERRYPGRPLLPPECRPDFNKDDFSDLLLWQTNRPGLTVDALSRAVAGEQWPIFIGVHLYEPTRQRFNPRPAGRIRLEVPVSWFLSLGLAAPVQHVVLEDVDGDGRTDLGLSNDSHTYSVWRYGDDGFETEPDLTIDLDAPMRGIAFRTAAPKGSGTLVGLETETQVYVIRSGTAR